MFILKIYIYIKIKFHTRSLTVLRMFQIHNNFLSVPLRKLLPNKKKPLHTSKMVFFEHSPWDLPWNASRWFWTINWKPQQLKGVLYRTRRIFCSVVGFFSLFSVLLLFFKWIQLEYVGEYLLVICALNYLWITTRMCPYAFVQCKYQAQPWDRLKPKAFLKNSQKAKFSKADLSIDTRNESHCSYHLDT